MYIKQIIIEGFKSYRERTVVEPFDPRHNVVVGRNGSGKSNFFAAMQFVLSDEFSQLRAEQRQALMYEGIGPRVISAFVEIIFDNTDRRLPFDKTEVFLRRMIGLKTDQYFLNKTIVPRTEVMALLESAGFSQVNPYYIVQQGEIIKMATATDSGRLKLLQEVAGTTVHDKKYQATKIILNETQEKFEKTAELLAKIEERLQALEIEKKELKEYHRWDKQRRCLEYTIYQREANDAKKKLEALKESYDTIIVEQRNLGRAAKRAQENISAAVERISDATEEYEIAEHVLHMHREEIEQLAKKGMKLSLLIKDLRQEINHNEEIKKNAETELPDLERKINEKIKELETINPKYEALIKEEEKLTHNLTLKEQQRQAIYVKKGRKNQFHTEEDRDAWMQEQLKQLTKQIQDEKAQFEEIQGQLTEDLERQKILEMEINKQILDIEQQKKSIENYEIECYKEIADKEKVHSELKELYRQESILEAKLSAEQEKLVQVELNLRILFGKQVLTGTSSIRKVLNTFRESSGSSEVVDCYCGQIIDNFTCDESLFTCVEVIAGKRLFHHIVENDVFGTMILREMNRQKLPGEVTFMPLNRLRVTTPEYPNSPDAIPMITKLEYDEKYGKALRFIFGKTLICRNLEVATILAKETRLDCITIDGDLVSSRGSLTGGYYNRERTPLGHYKTRNNIVVKIGDLENRLATIKAKIGRLTQTSTLQINKIQRLESLIRKAKSTCERMEVDMIGMKNELNDIQKYRVPNEKRLAQCSSRLEGMQVTKEGWERELNHDLSSQLQPDEQALLDNLNAEIQSLTKQNKIVFEKRINIEKEKTKLDNILTNNLMRRRDELKRIIQEMSLQDHERKLELFLSQHANIEEQKEKTTNAIEDLNKRLESAANTLKTYTEELDKWKSSKKDIMDKIEEKARNFELFTNKSSIFEQKIAEVNERIRKLGVLPSKEVYQKFTAMTNKYLFKELENTNKQLKKYSHVNQKAIDQFVAFTDERDTLVKRKEELDRSREKIELLMAVLDQKKFDATQFTFNQVSAHFGEVFKGLVPSGSAKLVMKIADAENNSEDDDSQTANYHNFVGIGIKVSFSGRQNVTSDMIRLSGGQKSLVALALIFAIQKCDPAPFYLFDEIDHALDAQHREAVAAMIHQMSSEAQFITTTFRPELLRRANKFYGTKFSNKVSHIECVTKEEAADFLEKATFAEDTTDLTDAPDVQ